MIIYEIYARAGPFEGEDPRKILPKVCHPRLNKRPPIPETCPSRIVDLMKKCWSSNAFFRPSAKDIDYALVEMSPTDVEPLSTATERVRDTLKRKPTSLYDVFPKHIADALNAGKKVEAESHEIVTVVFSDIVGFTTISEQFTPLKVSNMLDRLYQAFDKLADKHHIFKVETIGDAYMGVTNLDGSEYDTHVKQVAEYAQEAIRAASKILIDEEDPSMGYVSIRVGFHSGPVVSNVIGSLNPRYGLFGDTVNTASSMESNSMPGKIHCTCTSAQLLQTQAPDIPLTLRGMIKIQGKGKMKTYWVGDDDLVSMPLSTLSTHQPIVSPVVECDCQNNTKGLTQFDANGLDIAENSIVHKSHGTLDTKLMDSDDLHSQSTHETEEYEHSCGSVGGPEHFIQVHTQSQHTSCASTIRMDGGIEMVGDQACYSS
jgi:class 3 adenylate cyclase